MRDINITVRGQTFLVREVAYTTLNRRRVTEIEVREDCGSYYHQYGNGHVPRGASESAIYEYIRELYTTTDEEYAVW